MTCYFHGDSVQGRLRLQLGSGSPARLLCCFLEFLACVLRGFKKLGRDELPYGVVPNRQSHVVVSWLMWCNVVTEDMTSVTWDKIVIGWCRMVNHEGFKSEISLICKCGTFVFVIAIYMCTSQNVSLFTFRILFLYLFLGFSFAALACSNHNSSYIIWNTPQNRELSESNTM